MRSRGSREQVLRCPTSNLHVWELTSRCSTCELEFAARSHKHERTKARLCCNENIVSHPFWVNGNADRSKQTPGLLLIVNMHSLRTLDTLESV